MNEAKRMSISMTADMEQAIVDLRRTDRFCRSSYAEVIREVINAGLQSMKHSGNASNTSGTRSAVRFFMTT